MGQNGKVVHWPDKALETAELQLMIREGGCISPETSTPFRGDMQNTPFNRKYRFGTKNVFYMFKEKYTRWGAVPPVSCWSIPLFRAKNR
jgi:hypothetical protein